MMRQALIDRGIGIDGGFRLRGREVSRVEGFSDAAFAFAITLLVVSLEVPSSFDELLDVMRGVPAFAVCFATLAWLWSAHYRFFRRFGLQDRLTIVLNSALLFVVMLYVYPLKFVFTIFMGMLTGIRPRSGAEIRPDQIGDLFVVYGIGYVAVFVLLGALNLRAFHLRGSLELDSLEQLITRQEIARCLWLAAVGLLSILIALVVPGGAAGLAGLAYALIGAVEFIIGVRYGRMRDQLASAANAPAAGAPS